MRFVIATEDGTLVEARVETPEDGGLWWRYEAKVNHPDGPAKMMVTAKGLPGHVGSLRAGKDVA